MFQNMGGVIITLTVLFLSALGVFYVRSFRGIRNKRGYKVAFQRLISQLEELQFRLNRIAETIHLVKNPNILDYYEGCLNFMQTLAEAVSYLTPRGSSVSALKSAIVLAKDCEARILKIEGVLVRYFQKQEITLADLYSTHSETYRGCYFCSCPIEKNRLGWVRVRLDSKIEKVLSCQPCKERLQQTKTVKVLHFSKNGKTIHWSQDKDYVPAEQYWKINQQEEALNKTVRLSLITTNHGNIGSDDN